MMLFLLRFGIPIAGCPTETHTEYWRYAGTVRSLFVSSFECVKVMRSHVCRYSRGLLATHSRLLVSHKR